MRAGLDPPSFGLREQGLVRKVPGIWRVLGKLLDPDECDTPLGRASVLDLVVAPLELGNQELVGEVAEFFHHAGERALGVFRHRPGL